MLNLLFPQGWILIFIFLGIVFGIGIVLGMAIGTFRQKTWPTVASLLIGTIVAYILYLAICRMVLSQLTGCLED